MDRVIYEVKVTLDDQINKGNSSLSSQIQMSDKKESNTDHIKKTSNEDIKDKHNTAVSSAIIGGYTLLQEAKQVYTFARDLMVTQKVSSLYITGDNLSIKNTQRQIAIEDTVTNHIESALTPILTASVGKSFGEISGLGKAGTVIGYALGMFSMFKNVISSFNNYSARVKMFEAQKYQDNYIKSLNAERLVKNTMYYR